MLRTLCDEGFAGEIGFLNYARSPGLRALWPELRELALAQARAAGSPRLHARARPQLDRALLPRAPPRGHLRARQRGDVRVRPARADRLPSAPSGRRTACRAGGRDLHPARAEIRHGRRRGLVRFAASGREAANSGLPLLEQAEDAGLSPDHGCRMGICNTCSCRKRPAPCATSSPARPQAPARSRSASACPCRSAMSRSTSEHRTDLERSTAMSTSAPDPHARAARDLRPGARRDPPARRRRLGERDANYIRKVIRAQRGLEVAGRGLLFVGSCRPPGSPAPPPSRCRRSSTTWRSATT